ncbi:alkaline phosphatase family protein [Kitasatospora sp. NPDC096147]|uniref:alkaline phosphatase family protein n=1 Tax=Kitasatospora sp. NPDC096147 TaxID=3364093 RepID=UPI00381F139D
MNNRRLLVVGIDGVRFDLLPSLHTPHQDEVAAAGFLGRVEVDPGTPTMSGPCWATVVTGVSVVKHGVWGNRFDGHRLGVFPDFTTRLALGHGLRTLAAGGWTPLFVARDGGPMFAAPSRLSYIGPTADTPEAWEECDLAVATDSARILAESPELHAAFVYLGAVDETAHFLGCGPAYRTSIETADRHLGTLLAGLRRRPGHADEEWTVIVVTDHGHRDEGGHGGRSPEETTAWIAACGPDIPPGAPAPDGLRHADVAAHAYAALGIPIDPHWSLDGRPFSASARR